MNQKIAYLTIDDGPTVNMKEKINFLDSKGIKAIWFCLEKILEKFSNLAIYGIKRGYIIGNHSYDHPNFSKIDLDETRNQVAKTDKIVDKNIEFKLPS